VGADQGKVAIFQGVSQDVGPIHLSHVESTTDVTVDDLPDFYRQQVEETISVDTLADARARVEVLRTEAAQCALLKAGGGSCTTSTSTTTPTTTPATTATTTTAPTTVPTTSATP
jgi:protein phosphatase